MHNCIHCKTKNVYAKRPTKCKRFNFSHVLVPVMRVLGIPSRVVTVFNAAHDTDGNLSVEEYYSSTGEKLNLTKDSVWLVSLYLRSDFFF